MQDWFVPVLFQEELDPQLITRVPAEQVRAITRQQRTLALGNLPAEPGHTFVGRSRELLRAERLLEQVPYVVLRGEGGEGKTTLAAELARWLVATGRFRRAAFVSLENLADARPVLYALGDQLVPNFQSEARGDDTRALQLVERALADRPTLLVLDNMESVLPPAPGSPAAAAFEPEVLARILDLATRLGRIGRTRLIFTSREALPAPFERNHVTIDRLDRPDAIALVGRVLGEGNLLPHAGRRGRERRGDRGAGRRRRLPRPQPRAAGRRGRRLRRPPRHAAPARADGRPSRRSTPTTASARCWPASSCRCAGCPPRPARSSARSASSRAVDISA